MAQRTRQRETVNQELKNGELDWRQIVDSIPGLVALLTAAGNVEMVNRQVLEYFDQTLEELRHWGTSGVIHSEDLPHVIEVFTQSIASGSPYEIVQRFRRSDGVFRWFQNRGFPLRDANGQIVRWCVLLNDIDDRKHAEDAVRASERNLRRIIDAIPTLAWCNLADGPNEFLNERWHEYTGLPPEESHGWGWQKVFHPEDLPALMKRWQELLVTGEPDEIEARIRRHDGVYRWFLIRVHPFRDESGTIVRWYGTSTDIEDRKRAEAELKQTYLHLTEAQRLSKTGSFITDLLANEHNWSDEAFRIFELDPAAKLTVQMIRDFIHPEDLPSFEAMIARAISGIDVDFVFRIVTSRGAVKYVRSAARVIQPIEGRPLFCGALQDITESKVAEEALNRTRSELAHVARATALSALTASIAHEVSQPLSGIITNASTCLRMLDGDPPNVNGARETARRTIRDGNRASDVIQRLRALYSKKEFTLEPLDLSEAAREVIALSLSDLQRNRVILRSELADDLPHVVGDRVQLQQVILNFLRNGSDAMVGIDDRPRHMLVKTEREAGDRVRLTVRDAGVGVDRQNIDKLFDPFYTTKSGGMGIGLSVSRSIIERHRGRVWAEPNDGPGATFAFSIPCRPETDARASR